MGVPIEMHIYNKRMSHDIPIAHIINPKYEMDFSVQKYCFLFIYANSCENYIFANVNLATSFCHDLSVHTYWEPSNRMIVLSVILS